MGTKLEEPGVETSKSAATDEGRPPPKDNDFLLVRGLWLTLAWLSVLATYTALNWSKFDGLKPNELGDFFAGGFAPLAFLWLVLSFYQQGKELKNSADALWLQGRELQHSVEQQRQLVEVTREQLQFESRMLEAQREDLMRRSRPILKLTTGSTMKTGNELKVDFVLTNHGRSCTDVNISITGGTRPVRVNVLSTGEQTSFRKRFAPGDSQPFTVTVMYIDEQLMPGQVAFSVTHEEGKNIAITQGIAPV